ncbi:hypothetical protein A2U01_0111347, partial [Trifolium medium]|nr:hypothetical protein [Trifolium medium]
MRVYPRGVGSFEMNSRFSSGSDASHFFSE